VAKRQTISSEARWESVVGYSRAVRVGKCVWVAGTTAAAEGGGVVGEVFADIRPATSMVEVSRLIDPALLVEIEADAVVL